LKPTQESQESNQENLDPLKSHSKNLESNQEDQSRPVEILSKNQDLVRTPQRICL
jgi:hypothetical protein